MKLQKKLLVFVMVLVLSLSAFAIGASAETSAPITYEGLSARTTQDFAGLRAIYKVDESKFGEGAVIYGVLAASATKVDSIEALTVAMDGEGKLSNAANTQMVVVRDDTNKNDPTNTYTNAEKTEFAYTIAYFYESQTPDILKNDFFFRAFYIVGNDAPVYVGMSGDNFGMASSLFDVATVLSTKDDFKDLQSVKNVLTRASSLKTSATFKPADATEGKIILDNMAPGIYQVAVKGSTLVGNTDNCNFGFQINETKEGYAVRTKSLNSTDEFVTAFAARLLEGTNTLVLFNKLPAKLTIDEYSLTLIQEVPFASEGKSVSGNIYSDAVDNIYAKVNCAIADHEGCTGVHYYKSTSAEGRKWTYKADGVVDTDYFLSIDKLPANAHIRDCTAGLVIQKDDGGNILYDDTTKKALTRVATEKDGEANFGVKYKAANSEGYIDLEPWTSNSYGKNYCTGNSSVAGSIFVRPDATIKMTINAPKAGTYKIYAAFNDGGTKLAYSVNGGAFSDAKFVTKTSIFGSAFTAGSGNQGSYYGELGSVTLNKDSNVVLMNVTNQWIGLSGVYFVLDDGSHTVDFVYADALGAQHILSRQIVADGADADVPTFFPSACYSIADASAAKTVTKDTTIVVDVAHEGEAVLVAPSFGTAGSYTMPDCTKCGEKGLSYTLSALDALDTTPITTITDGDATGEIKVTATKAGVYKVEYASDATVGTYITLQNKIDSYVAKIRIKSGQDATKRFINIYLEAGENTLKWETAKPVSFTQISSIDNANTVVQAVKGMNLNNSAKYFTFSKKVTIAEDGFYYVAGFGVTANIASADVTFTFTGTNVYTLTSTMKPPTLWDGSTGASIYYEHGVIYLEAGEYTIDVATTQTGGYTNIGDTIFHKLEATPAD